MTTLCAQRFEASRRIVGGHRQQAQRQQRKYARDCCTSAYSSRVKAETPTVLHDALDLSRFDTFLLDLDGVLWQGDVPIEGAADAVCRLRDYGKRLIYVTNNSSKSRRTAAQKFERMGFGTVDRDEIVTASYSAARWLSAKGYSGDVLVVGDSGIDEELAEFGYDVVRPGADEDPGMTTDEIRVIPHNPRVGAVIVGASSSVTYRQLCHACAAVLDGAIFLATNLDAADRHGTRYMPGAGAVVQYIQTVTGIAPTAVAGKPGAWMQRLLQQDYGVQPSRTCCIGDRLDTDVKLGVTLGCTTVLTLTGISNVSDCEMANERGDALMVPTVICPSISTLIP